MVLLQPTAAAAAVSYHAFAFDQRGHGDSERPDCCYAIEDLVADAVAFLDAVEVEQATVVGHSGGSFTARGWPRPTPSGSPGWC